jgi:hypothetical protein
MFRWRKFLLVLLLILSLPIRLVAAASMNCEVSQFVGEVAPVGHVHVEQIAYSGTTHHDRFVMAGVEGHHHGSGVTDHHHLAGQCSMCASCCFGAAAPTAAGVAGPGEIAIFVAPHQPSVGAVRFLTGGIERPPRLSLA